MNQAQIIKQLQQARPDHVFWVQEGRKLVKGLPEDQISKPLQCKACKFSNWFEEEGHRLVHISELKNMPKLHQDMHSAYTALYYTTFDRRKKARATIISGGVEIPIDELPFRRKKLKVLEANTIKFLKLLLLVEEQVSAMKVQDFENGWLCS